MSVDWSGGSDFRYMLAVIVAAVMLLVVAWRQR